MALAEQPWEESLRDRARTLFALAKKHPGTWQEQLLPNDFKLGASVERGSQAVELRFRVLAGGKMTPVEFSLEVRRLAAYLGSAEWDFEEHDAGLWWEITCSPG